MGNIEQSVEFFSDPFGRVHVRQDGKTDEFAHSQFVVLTMQMHEEIEQSYPECSTRLEEIVLRDKQNLQFNLPMLRFRKVERFIRCNFGTYDEHPDIDRNARFRLERVSCPLRGVCKDEGVICLPKVSHELTKAQVAVLQLLAERKTVLEISAHLDIRPTTVEKHLKNAMIKTGIHSRDQLLTWGFEKQIIKI